MLMANSYLSNGTRECSMTVPVRTLSLIALKGFQKLVRLVQLSI